MKQKILIILGPTAVGKSGLAVKLARKFNSEVISADSRQVYKGLDIGTGKITKKEMGGIKHYLLDVANPKKQFSVVKYVAMAEKSIREIVGRGKIPIIAGGTGFYIQALVDGIILPDVPPNNTLRKKLLKKSAPELFKILYEIDSRRARSIDRKNKRRIIRAIEIVMAMGKVPVIRKSQPKYESLFIGLYLPIEDLENRIKIRLNERLKKGMIKEAVNLHSKDLSWKRMDELGLEYRYLALYLQDKMTKEEMTEKLAIEIRRYAKSQMTWFKRDSRIKWFRPSQVTQIEKGVGKFLKNKM